jgi:Uma2 family endonuclease
MPSMPPATSRPRKTVEDYLALPDDVRAELIDGELYVTPSPEADHQRVVLCLGRRLARYVEAHACGEVFVAPLDVHLPTGDVVQPDVLFVSTARSDICRRWIHGAPDLVVEVLSPTHAERDRAVKRALYARSGVAEYWIVDPQERSIEVLRLAGESYEPAGWFRPGETLVSACFPGLVVALDALWP